MPTCFLECKENDICYYKCISNDEYYIGKRYMFQLPDIPYTPIRCISLTYHGDLQWLNDIHIAIGMYGTIMPYSWFNHLGIKFSNLLSSWILPDTNMPERGLIYIFGTPSLPDVNSLFELSYEEISPEEITSFAKNYILMNCFPSYGYDTSTDLYIYFMDNEDKYDLYIINSISKEKYKYESFNDFGIICTWKTCHLLYINFKSLEEEYILMHDNYKKLRILII